MQNNRDDFSATDKRTMAERVSWICSFPGCNRRTVGPKSDDPTKRVNNGIAAHIHAAAPGGPRYNPKMSSKERKHISNGIWMCRDHGNLIDADNASYSPSMLHNWKLQAEEKALKNLELPSQDKSEKDLENKRKIINDWLELHSDIFNVISKSKYNSNPIEISKVIDCKIINMRKLKAKFNLSHMTSCSDEYRKYINSVKLISVLHSVFFFRKNNNKQKEAYIYEMIVKLFDDTKNANDVKNSVANSSDNEILYLIDHVQERIKKSAKIIERELGI